MTDMMTRNTTLTIAFSILVLTSIHAQKQKKSGKNLGAIPAVSYNSDEGFQYGAVLNLFDYGDGSRYPAYDYSAYLEASAYTKGSQLLRFFYDTEQWIPGIRSFFDLSYKNDYMMDFYGYNGYQTIYNQTTETSNRAFYKMRQRQFSLLADFKGKLPLEHLNWLASYNLYNYKNGDVDVNRLNEGVSPLDPDYLDGSSLYDHYVDWGLIGPNEAEGGWVHAFKAGILYDSRPERNNPSRGLYTELMLEFAPNILNKMPYLRYGFVHRQYVGLIPKKLNAAIRIGTQGKLGDNAIPFFRKPGLISPFSTRTSITGLGGANSLRGILRNRVVSDGFAYTNVELRWRILDFSLIGQDFYLGINGFYDAGMVTDAVQLSLDQLNTSDRATYFSETNVHSLHQSVGGGLKAAMNENFILSAEAGKALDKRDGDRLSIYINLNYLF